MLPVSEPPLSAAVGVGARTAAAGLVGVTHTVAEGSKLAVAGAAFLMVSSQKHFKPYTSYDKFVMMPYDTELQTP